MTWLPGKILTLLLLVLTTSGCCLRRQTPETSCPPFQSQRTPLAVSEKSFDATVSYDFENLPTYSSARKSILGQIATSAVVQINLPEVIVLAAQNSELADLIESERHAIKCQSDNCDASFLDIILEGEALEHRNLAAGSAAEIFLGLTQITMQMELLESSKQRISELQATVAAADEAGFATAEGKNEIAKAQVRVNKFESKLSEAHQRLTYQLNLLINIDEQNPVIFQPVHHLNPQEPSFDVRYEVAIAETNRPGVQGLAQALQQGGDGDAIFRLLGIFDNRLGIKLPLPASTKLRLRAKLKENLQAAAQENSGNNRRQQAEQVLETRKKQARVAAGEAMLGAQTAFEDLTLTHQDIQRLNQRESVLAASQEIDAKNAYLEQLENWVELRQAKSDRIVAAIKVETQKIKLLQAQGLLLDR
jgi:hypothetical protein